MTETAAQHVEWVGREAAMDGGVVRDYLHPARTVLDVGCGIFPQTLVEPELHFCVEPYAPYVERLRQQSGHDRRFVFLQATWDAALPLFLDASVDTVFVLDVIEHLDEQDGRRLLDEAKRIARLQVVVFTPLGFYPQTYEPDELDRWGMAGGRWQTHRSGWDPGDFPGWRIVACKDFHDVDEHGRPLDPPFGAFWAIHDRVPTESFEEAPAHTAARPVVTPRAPDPVRARARGRRLRILFVAMGDSPHAARWISQLEGLDFEPYLFPAEIPAVIPVTPLLHELAPSLRLVEGWPIPGGGRNLALRLSRPFKPGWNVRAWQLARVIRKLRPDLVHSLELQHAGYLTHSARMMVGESFPPWLVSNWGSDTYVFGRLEAHRERIREVLSGADFYTAECHRDVEAASELGLRGVALPVLPAAGGIDLAAVARFRRPGPTSARRTIALRGYQGWAGRALTGLRAIERAADVLGEYTIVVYNWATSPDVPLAVELAAGRTGLDFKLLPYGPRDDVWRLHGSARASIALAIGDGISTSMLEAITMGSFPIQSQTSCADEWLEDGRTGLLVHPEEPEDVERAIRKVVADDALVDTAAGANAEVVRERLDQSVVRPQAVALYEQALAAVLDT